MSAFYGDSSAVVKRYVKEAGTAWVNNLLSPTAGHSVYTARITTVEVVSAIARRARGGSITPADATAAIAQFKAEFGTLYLPVELSPALASSAAWLAEQHALRAYDAVHLATAREINAQRLMLGLPTLTLVSSDAALNAAATVEGVPVDDPNTHP